ncbi:MAG: hypothetical protein H0W78_04630 [Planctomycetes bacterium]|nr:hypothetical protein [Planctomycetota bacterium]
MTMRPYYDFSKGTRGKYAKKFRQGTNLVALAPDVQRLFPNSSAVNKALRELIKLAKKSSRVAVL